MAGPRLRQRQPGQGAPSSYHPAEAGGRFGSPKICAQADPHSPPQGVERTGIGITDLGSNPGFVLHKQCDLEQVINYSETRFPYL